MADFVLPNIRKMFIPDKGYILFDADLKGADAQVVAWEANDEKLKKAFREGLDVHSQNAEEILGEEFASATGRTRYNLRQNCKAAVHLTNYGGKERTLAISQRWTIDRAKQFQANWFYHHPGIREWQNRIQHDLNTTRTIWNKFGYRIIYFDRVDGLLPKALAWTPQSTVALVCFKGALKLKREFPSIEILIQVHDNLVFQVPFHLAEKHTEIQEALAVPIPYSDPLWIPWELSKSEKSWGDCSKI